MSIIVKNILNSVNTAALNDSKKINTLEKLDTILRNNAVNKQINTISVLKNDSILGINNRQIMFNPAAELVSDIDNDNHCTKVLLNNIRNLEKIAEIKLSRQDHIEIISPVIQMKNIIRSLILPSAISINAAKILYNSFSNNIDIKRRQSDSKLNPVLSKNAQDISTAYSMGSDIIDNTMTMVPVMLVNYANMLLSIKYIEAHAKINPNINNLYSKKENIDMFEIIKSFPRNIIKLIKEALNWDIDEEPDTIVGLFKRAYYAIIIISTFVILIPAAIILLSGLIQGLLGLTPGSILYTLLELLVWSCGKYFNLISPFIKVLAGSIISTALMRTIRSYASWQLLIQIRDNIIATGKYVSSNIGRFFNYLWVTTKAFINRPKKETAKHIGGVSEPDSPKIKDDLDTDISNADNANLDDIISIGNMVNSRVNMDNYNKQMLRNISNRLSRI